MSAPDKDMARRAATEEEARATLEAIRRGEIDALVFDGSEVVLLETASSPFRELVERMRHGVVTISQDGRVTYFNARFRAMTNLRSRALAGMHVEELVAESDRDRMAGLCDAPNGQAELHLRNGPAVQATMIAHRGQRMFLFTDLTERQRHLASGERTRRFLGLLAGEFHDMVETIQASAQVFQRAATDPESKAALEAITRTTQMMGALVEDLRRLNPEE